MDNKKKKPNNKSSFAAQAQATLAGLASPDTMNVIIPDTPSSVRSKLDNENGPGGTSSGLTSPGPGTLSEGRNYSNLVQSTMNTIENLQVVWMDSDEEQDHRNESKYTEDNEENERQYDHDENGAQEENDVDDDDDENGNASPPTEDDDDDEGEVDTDDRAFTSPTASYRNIDPSLTNGTTTNHLNDRTPYDRWSPTDDDNNHVHDEEDNTDNEYGNDNHHLQTLINQQYQERILRTDDIITINDSKLNDTTTEDEENEGTVDAVQDTRAAAVSTTEGDVHPGTSHTGKRSSYSDNRGTNNDAVGLNQSTVRDESKVEIDQNDGDDNGNDEESKAIEVPPTYSAPITKQFLSVTKTAGTENDEHDNTSDAPSSESESIAIHPSPESKSIQRNRYMNEGSSRFATSAHATFSPPRNPADAVSSGTATVPPSTLSPTSASRVMMELDAARKLLSDAQLRLQSSRMNNTPSPARYNFANTTSSPNTNSRTVVPTTSVGTIHTNRSVSPSINRLTTTERPFSSSPPTSMTTTTTVSPQVIGLVRSLYDVESSLAEHARSLDTLRTLNRSRLSTPSSSPPEVRTVHRSSSVSPTVVSSSSAATRNISTAIENSYTGNTSDVPERIVTDIEYRDNRTTNPNPYTVSSSPRATSTLSPSTIVGPASPANVNTVRTSTSKLPSPIITNVSSPLSGSNKLASPPRSSASLSGRKNDMWSTTSIPPNSLPSSSPPSSRYTDEALYYASVSFRNHQQQVQEESRYHINKASSPSVGSPSRRSTDTVPPSEYRPTTTTTTNTVAASLAAQAAQQATQTVLETQAYTNNSSTIASPDPVFTGTSRTSVTSPRTPSLQFSPRKGTNPLSPAAASTKPSSFTSQRKQYKQQQYTNELAVIAADAAFIAGLGIPTGANPYLHPQYAFYRAGTVGGSTIPPSFLASSSSAALPSRVPTPSTSAVAAAIDRFAYPHNLVPASSFGLSSHDNEGIPSFRKSGNLRKIFDQVSYYKDLPTEEGRTPASLYPSSSNEETASAILTSLCHVIGIAPHQISTRLVPRIQELCRIAVTSSSLDAFAVGVCDKLSQNLLGLLQQSNSNEDGTRPSALPSTVPIGLQQAHALLDAALAELTSLRKLHYVLETRTQDHYYDNYIQNTIVNHQDHQSPSNHGDDDGPYSLRTERDSSRRSRSSVLPKSPEGWNTLPTTTITEEAYPRIPSVYEKFTPAPLLSSTTKTNRYSSSKRY